MPDSNEPLSLVTGALGNGDAPAEAPAPPAPPPARRAVLEARFCELFAQKAQAEQQVRELHDELMRVQGAIREVTAG